MDNLTIFEYILTIMNKGEGFKGQRTVILPEFIINELHKDPLGSQLFLTDIGYYPHAKFHYFKRKEGCCQFILIYCIEGKGWFSIDGKRNIVYANQYFIIPQGIPHAYGSDNKDPWSIYWLHFTGTHAAHFIDISAKAKTISPSKISRIDYRIDLFEEIIQNLEMGYSYENLQYANICLYHYLASFKYIGQFRQVRTVREKDLIEDIIFHMKESLDKKLTLETIASEAGLSTSHISLLFRRRTGRSVMDYLINLRIQKACQYLDNSELRIKKVASLVGYDDPYYFSRIFKKIMGTSPGNYRTKPKG